MLMGLNLIAFKVYKFSGLIDVFKEVNFGLIV